VGLVLLGALLAAPGVATALDEAQISAVSCSGLTVTQVGLPANVPVEVALYDTTVGNPLAEVAARADAAGRLSVRLLVSLRDVRQVVAEVEHADHEGVEYGEVGADLPTPCSPTPRPVAPAVLASPHPVAASRHDVRRVAVGGAVLGLVAGGVVLLRLRSRRIAASP
jgi:hypothetical protein